MFFFFIFSLVVVSKCQNRVWRLFNFSLVCNLVFSALLWVKIREQRRLNIKLYVASCFHLMRKAIVNIFLLLLLLMLSAAWLFICHLYLPTREKKTELSLEFSFMLVTLALDHNIETERYNTLNKTQKKTIQTILVNNIS